MAYKTTQEDSMRLFIYRHQALVNTTVVTMVVSAVLLALPLQRLVEPGNTTAAQDSDDSSDRYTVTYVLPTGKTQVNSYAATPEAVRENALETASADLPTLPLPSPWFDPVYEPAVNEQLSLITKVVGHLQDTIALNMLTVQEHMLSGDLSGVIQGVAILQENIKDARRDHDALVFANQLLYNMLIATPIAEVQIQSTLKEYVDASEVVIAEIGSLLLQYETITDQSRVDSYQLPSQAEIADIERNAAAISAALVNHGVAFQAFVAATYVDR